MEKKENDDKKDEKKKFKVIIKNAKKLLSGWLDKIDPYVVVTYGGKEQKTKTKNNNEDPEFNEDFTFD